jgi:phosphodiesterase/alkaline phosphatase D-like protein
VGDLAEVNARMRLGITVKDRRYFLRTFRNCFVGDEACLWLKRNLDLRSKTEAVVIGKEMMAKYVGFV